jgi:hypothetical protein
LLLKRDAKQGDASRFVPHDAEKIVDVGSLLDVIGQMKVHIIELRLAGRITLRNERNGRR